MIAPDDMTAIVFGSLLLIVLKADCAVNFRKDFLTPTFPRFLLKVAIREWTAGVIDRIKHSNPSSTRDFLIFYPRLIFQDILFTLFDIFILILGLLVWAIVPCSVVGMAVFIVNYFYKNLM